MAPLPVTAAAVIAALVCLPRLFSLDYYLHIFVMSEIYAVLALSLSLLVGFTGQVSMGHAAFYGMGAYTSAILSIRAGLSFWVTFWAAGVFAGLAAFIIGKLVLRLRGHVLAITTAFFGVLVAVVMNNWIPVTNGPMGITGIPRPSPFSFLGMNIALESRTDYYFLGLVFVAGVIYFLWRIENSRIGDAMIAVRENEELAASLGIDTMKSKVLAFTIAGALAGMAGSFYAHYILLSARHLYDQRIHQHPGDGDLRRNEHPLRARAGSGMPHGPPRTAQDGGGAPPRNLRRCPGLLHH